MNAPYLLLLLTVPMLSSASSTDWLVDTARRPAAVRRDARSKEIELSNGLIRRQWRLAPNAATVAFDSLTNGQALLRAVRPEAMVEIDGRKYAIGGLQGQPEHAYLRREWLDRMTTDPAAFQFAGFETGRTATRFEWKRVRYSENRPWPPPGASLALRFTAPAGNVKGVDVIVHYEMYDDIPVLSKWLEIRNGTGRAIRLNTFISEVLAAVEYGSEVNDAAAVENPYLQVETDYSFLATHPQTTNSGIADWVPDKQYTTQVNYLLNAPLLLETRPPIGPDVIVQPGTTFETFRIFELVHDSTDRERRGLAVRLMYRTLAPWATENPILMHVRKADPDSVKLAIDQCAAVGFEMVIMSFGSGFNPESEDPAYIEQIAGLVRYARSKGVELGGYSLLASRKISPEDDVINPKTGRTGGAIFDNSPCLGSRWGIDYFRKLMSLFEKTGLSILEHDGSYPGDLCASTSHPGHRGLADSQWTQWKQITDFYHWCRARGIYLNVPDWYFLAGSNKTAMGYREVNWSLPRERQIILGRQNIFDGTWNKAPSMGWMFVPLVQYHGGGAAATLEPLREHLDAYGAHLAQNFASGVQACYRGPRLYDSEETKTLVKRWVDFYKKYRAILDSDIVHVRRPDARDLDVIMHVNPRLPQKGLAVIYNPLSVEVSKTVTLPLYYTGLTTAARIREQEGPTRRYALDRQSRVEVPVKLGPGVVTWLVVE
ncbi:MAG: hypothetical protein LLG20_25370 [Acidobacteriales bacterium]|nr:hypothetical protein [Terriglobales bacterium]